MSTIYTKLDALLGQHAKGDPKAPKHFDVVWDGEHIGQVYSFSAQSVRGYTRSWRAITPDAHNLYGGTVRRDAVRVLREHSLKPKGDSVTVYTIPDPPDDLTEVWDMESVHWTRKQAEGEDYWISDSDVEGTGEICYWAELLYNYGPVRTREQEES